MFVIHMYVQLRESNRLGQARHSCSRFWTKRGNWCKTFLSFNRIYSEPEVKISEVLFSMTKIIVECFSNFVQCHFYIKRIIEKEIIFVRDVEIDFWKSRWQKLHAAWSPPSTSPFPISTHWISNFNTVKMRGNHANRSFKYVLEKKSSSLDFSLIFFVSWTRRKSCQN